MMNPQGLLFLMLPLAVAVGLVATVVPASVSAAAAIGCRGCFAPCGACTLAGLLAGWSRGR